MYKIKQIPEDFIVREISGINLSGKGNYFYYQVKKKGWNTLDVVAEISRKTGIPFRDIGIAGNKDKKAVTEQVISIKNKKISGLQIRDVCFEYLGRHHLPLTLGDLQCNHFEITVRNLDNFEFKLPEQIINYFDEQRFGENNQEVGKCLVQKEFRKAGGLIGLEVEGNDAVKAIKKIPLRMLKMYINAYQSHLWNDAVGKLLKGKIPATELPLLGFMTELASCSQEVRKIIEDTLTREKLSLNDFIIRQIPQLSQEGELRKVFAEIRELKILEKETDELNPGKKKARVSFILGKGSYATLVIKEMFS